MSLLDPMAFVNIKIEDVCIKTEPGDGKNAVDKTDIKYSEDTANFCQTCFINKNNIKLRDMMKRYYHNNKYEVYSEMMDYCFLLQPRRNNKNNVYFICESCILKLREAVNFRNQMEDAQINIKQNINLPSLSFASFRDIEKNVEDEFELIDDEISCLLNSDNGDPFSTVDKETQSVTDLLSADENEYSNSGTVISNKCESDNLDDEKTEKYVTAKENRIPSAKSYNSPPFRLDPKQVICKDTLSQCLNLSGEIHRSVHADHKQLTEHGQKYRNKLIDCLLYPGKRFKIGSHRNIHTKRKHGVDNETYRYMATVTSKSSNKTLPVKINSIKDMNNSLNRNINSDVKSVKKLTNKRYIRNECLPYKLDTNQLQCKICTVEFESHQDLQKHMPSHFPNFTCETCGRVFANRKQITSHKRLQHQNEIIECPLCPEKRFKNRAYMSVHMKRFHGNDRKDFRCSYCNESFIKSEQRERHLILVHELAEMRYKCESCDATFSSNARRSDHFRRVHLNERKFVCEICSYSCFVKGGLEKHMLKHTGVRNFSCSVCQKKFLRKCTLDLHIPIHTGEKKHVCEICGKAFIQKCALNAHMQVHERRRLKGKGKI